MKFPRSSGILLHPTSLPGPYGIGEIGPEAYRFADFLHSAGLKIWQVLPLNPTGFADSPYQCFSAFAGNPLLISTDGLVDEGVLSRDDLKSVPSFPANNVDFGAVIPYKLSLLRRAARNFFTSPSPPHQLAYETFCNAQAAWLEDFALFMAAKDAHDLVVWTEWDPALAARKPDAMQRCREKLADSIAAHKYWQFLFFRQWHTLKNYCHQRGIHIMGDLPIYVAHDSADVWSHPDLFHLDAKGRPTKVAGVPPDYFSATGQLWGNPIYRWDLMAQRGYSWWIERFRACLDMFDMLRVDHFRGFEAYWEIPAGETTAMNGAWIKGPGAELFRVVRQALGELPIVAENLGVITPAVEAIRHEFVFPGMAIFQFAFSTDPQAPTFRPHNYERNLVAYTGGHDNDTMCGWWRTGAAAQSTRSQADVEKEERDAMDYLGVTREQMDREVNWIFIRQVMRSVADVVLFPMQDVLGVGSEGRMNTPGTLGGNWKWRMTADQFARADSARIKKYATVYER
jgi:4-alpha-glucanotransferase